MNSPRVDLKPLIAVVTLAIGLGLVSAIDAVTSMFASAARVGFETRRDAENDLPTRIETRPASSQAELSCYDPNILPIWREIKGDYDFQQRMLSASGFFDCSELLQIKKIDLNRDGSDEFLVRGKGNVLCGGIGNCNYWILGRERGKVRTLLSAGHLADQYEFAVDEVQTARHKGYPEILLASYDAQHVLHFLTYRFDGTTYTESCCMSEVPKPLREGAGSWEVITCREFDRQRDEMRRDRLREANR